MQIDASHADWLRLHKSVFTTLDHYAQLPPDEIDRIMTNMETRANKPEVEQLADAVRAANAETQEIIRLLLKRTA